MTVSDADVPSSSATDFAPSAQDPPAYARSAAAERADLWSRAYLAMFAGYIALGLSMRLLGWIHGDASWFVYAARKILDGSFDVYSNRVQVELIPPLGATYAYTPFTAIIMAPFVGLANVFGWGQTGAEIAIAVPLLVADVLAMQQLRGLVRSWYATVDERFLFSGIFVSLFLTGLLLDSAYYGHNEGLMLLFLLLTLRLTPTNLWLGGICAGFALATKHTTMFALLPVGLVLLVAGQRSSPSGREDGRSSRFGPSTWKAFFMWAAPAAGVFLAFLAIPLVRYPETVYYAFVTQISRLPLFGAGLPTFVDRQFQSTLSPTDYAVAHEYLLKYSNLVLIGVVAVACMFIVWRAYALRQSIHLVDSRLLALVAFGAVAQVVLGKWTSGHYYQLPLALLFVWDITRRSPLFEGRRGGTLDSFPWLGLGAAIVFRSITQIGIGWFKDALLLLLFSVLGVILLIDAGRTLHAREPGDSPTST